eukprot:gene27568-33295_t
MADLKSVVYRLLDKAGEDPRLTPRLLREKAEQKLNMPRGDLKAKREEIKDMIVKWYIEKKEREEEITRTVMKMLAKIGKVAGLAPAIFKGMKEMDSDEQRILELRKRLREKGLKFSDVPTTDEIEAIREDYERKKDLEGIDSSQIIDGPRKRPAKELGTVAEAAPKKVAVETSRAPTKYNAHNFASDEEAEAEL